MPRGRVPSLVSLGNGGIEMGETIIRSSCSRCKKGIPGGSQVALLRVQKAGFTNKRRLCLQCAMDVVEQTQRDLDAIRALLST